MPIFAKLNKVKMLTVSQLEEIKLIDSHYYVMHNKQISNPFPDLPVYSEIQTEPDSNKIKNKERIQRILKNYCSKKH